MSRGEMASEIPEMFRVFAPQLKAFTSVGVLLKYFRRKQVVFRLMLLLHELYITPL